MKYIKINKTIKIYLLLMLTCFLSEFIFRSVMHYELWSYATLRIFISTNIYTMLLSIIFSFFNHLFERITVSITCLAVSIYAMIQAGFYNYLGVYISLGTSSQAGAVKDYLGDYINSFKANYYLILLPLLILVIYYTLEIIFNRQEKKLIIDVINVPKKRKKKTEEIVLAKKELKKAVKKELKLIYDFKVLVWVERLSLLIILVGLCFLYVYTLNAKKMQNELQLESNKDLFKNPSNPNIAINQFGTTVFFDLDLKITIKPIEQDDMDIFVSNINNNANNVVTDMSRVIDDTAWKTLNENTDNKSYQTLNNYFMNRYITPKNSYTGLFEGKNAIFVMMESVNTLFVDPVKFPTLYKMYSEGYAWENAYSPRNSCSTGNNEMSGMVSLYTIYRSCTYNNYKNNTYFESIFNLFNNAGYTTSSYHNYTDQYYYRNIIHPKMGSGKFYDVNALDIKYNSAYKEWPSDVLLMDKAADHFLNSGSDKPFMAWITSVTSHQPYTMSSEFGDKYLDLYKDTGYPTAVKRYLSKLTELDHALAELLKRLEDAGELNDTVIIMYADHYPYGISTSNLQKAFDYNISEKYEIDRTPFIIYNAGVKGTVSSDLTSYMNVTPTVANLFNLNYDPRLYMGQDLFSETFNNRLVFADGSWQTDKGFYDATSGKISYYGSSVYENSEIVNINQEVKGMMKMSSLAITSNYFNYLGNGLKKYKIVETPKESVVSKESEINNPPSAN